MIDFDFNENCCGCTSCASSCPTNAIKMVANAEGFLMPVVTKDACINCGKCENVCPYINSLNDGASVSRQDFDDKKVYLYYSQNDGRKDSASGGFVYDVYRYFLGNGGYAVGCVWDQNIVAKYITSNQQADIRRMQSSKYVQSDMTSCYTEIKDLLKEGKQIVFCGTPCQTAGLHYYLGKQNYDNLLTICCICHGVPSPGVWAEYKKELEKKNRGILVDVNMRDKSYKGYATSYVRYTFDISDNITSASQKLKNVGIPTYLADPYIFLFTDNLYLRNSCYHCPYKGGNNKADIIVGDYHASIPEAGNLGCSTVITMNTKGDDFVKKLDGVCKVGEKNVVIDANNMLWKSVTQKDKRRQFFELFLKGGTDAFHQFLPMRFHIKRIINNIGLFSAYLSLKRRINAFLNRKR